MYELREQPNLICPYFFNVYRTFKEHYHNKKLRRIKQLC